MANDDSNNLGGKVFLDTTEFKAGVTDLNRQIRVIESGFKAAAAGMDDWGKSSEGLRLKINSLNQVTDLQKQKIANLTQQYKEVVAAKGEDSKQAQNLQVRINNETASLNKNLKELSNTSNALKNLGNDSKDTGQNVDKLNKSADETGNNFKELSGNLLKVTGIAAVGTMAVNAGKSVLGFSTDSQKAMNSFQAQTGASTSQMSQFKQQIDQIYADNFGESLDDIANSMAQVKQVTGESGDTLKNTTEDALLLRDTFGFEVPESIRAANSLIKNFGITGEQAYNLIAQGAQNGANKNDDLLDSLNEYSQEFKSLGFNAQDFTNILITGAENGSFSIDKMADAVKEFEIRSKDGSQTSIQGFQALGLNANQMFETFAKGGDGAKKAFQLVIDKLVAMKDPVAQNQAGVNLFGTQFEDLGIKGIASLGSISDKANITKDSLSQLNGVKYNDASSALEGLKRQLIESVGDPIGKEVTPKINNMINSLKKVDTSNIVNGFGWIVDNAGSIAVGIGTIVSAWAGFKVGTAINTAVQGVIEFNKATKDATLAQAALNLVMNANSVGVFIAAISAVVAGFILLWNTSSGFRNFFIGMWNAIKNATSSVVSAIITFFTVTIPTTFNNFIVFISQLPAKIGSFFMQLPSIIANLFTQAFTGIVNWGANVIAWVAMAIPNIINSIGTFFNELPGKIGYALDFAIGSFVKFGADAITWITTNVPIIIENIVNFFLTLPGKLWSVFLSVLNYIGQWGSNTINWIGTNVPKIVSSIINFFTSLPSRLWNIFLNAINNIKQWGSNIMNWAKATIPGIAHSIAEFFRGLPGDLLKIGEDLIKGLWNGISNMAKWVRDKIKDFASGVVKGFKDALGIHSPSKVMRKEVGVYVSSGVAQGIKDGIPGVNKSITDVANNIIKNKGIVTDAIKGIANNTATNVQVAGTTTIRNSVLTNTNEQNSTDTIDNSKKYGKELNENLGKGITDDQQKATIPVQNLVDTIGTKMSDLAISFAKNGQDSDTNLGTGITTNSAAATTPVNTLITNITTALKTFIQACIGHGQDTDMSLGTGITSNSTAVTGAVNNVISTVGNNLDTFATGAIQYGENTDVSLGTGVTSNAGNVTGSINNLISSITNIFSTFVNSCVSIGTGIVNAIGHGIQSSENNLVGIVHELTQKVIDAFTGPDGFDIQSPSKRLFEIGSYVIQGFINGLSSQDVLTFFKSKISSMLDVAGNVSQWLVAALAITDTPMNWLPGLEKLVQAESGGNPLAVNPQSVNGEHATGLLQTLPSTFISNAVKGLNNILNPIDNAVAAINYIKRIYGSIYNTPLFKNPGSYVGYWTGTDSTKPGLGYVNEKGWEVIDFSGGQMVQSHEDSINLLNRASSAINALNSAMSRLKASTTTTVNTSTNNTNSNNNVTIGDGDLYITLKTPDGKELARQVLPWVDIFQGKNLRKKKKGVTV
jgi:phage-related minor tail protein/SLT domain-containing protein